jgi:3-deoxy-7-phosphoheptulonate synthase
MHPALGIDMGKARIGIAATDPCGIMAHPVESIVIEKTEPLARIAQLVRERGIRTFETLTRNTLDVSVIPIIKERTHLPIIIDPSHATGDWKLVEAMSLAAVAAGCDGLMIEVHDQPECAWSDGSQSLKPEKFKALVEKVKKVAAVLGREC